MKNLKLIMLLFALCALVTTQTTFAQEDSRAASEKAEINRARNNENVDVANLKHKELRVLREKYEEATPEQRVAIQEEINVLKASYKSEVKDVEAEKALAESTQLENKYDISNKDEFLRNAKKRVKIANMRLMEAEKNGELTEEEIRQRKYKIGQVQKKLRQHEASISIAKVEIAKRNKEIKQLQE